MDIRDLCDHDICVCGEQYTTAEGYEVCGVPHPGDYREWYRLDDR